MKPMIKNGQKPISSKPTSAGAYEFGPSSILEISPELKAELDQKGLSYRFVDGGKLSQMGGFHKNGWRIYRQDKKASGTMDGTEFFYGQDPDGYVRRGTLVLAVKPKSMNDAHKAYLAERVESSKTHNARKAAELRALAKENRVEKQITIHEGFEENE